MPLLGLTLELGQQTPRLVLQPPAVSSAAQDAIDIYESCGQRLDPWQETGLRVGLGELEDLTWASFENCVICQRQNGKGAIIEALCLASLFIWGNQVTVYSAHRGDTARATFRRIRALIEGTPDLARRCLPINDSDEVITLVGGARLEFRTRTKSGGRGLTGELVILDEALMVDPDQLASLVPTLLARPYASLWYFSTVPASADQHLCTVRARAVAGDSRLSWVEWGNDAGVALDDVEAMKRANPALGIRITIDRLVDLRKILGDEAFATECLGIWPDMRAGTTLNPATWKTMLDPDSRRAAGGDVFIAFDMTPKREHGSVGMWGLRDDQLEHMQLVDYRPGVDWMVDRLGELAEVLRPALFVVERRNGAYAMVEDLAVQYGIREPHDPTCEDCKKRRCTNGAHRRALGRGNLLVLETAGVSDAVGQFIDGFRRTPAPYRHIGQKPLDDAVENVKAREVGDAGQLAWGRKISAVDIGPVAVVSYGKYGAAQWLFRQTKDKPRSKIW